MGTPFIRGDANNDGSFIGLIDTLFLLGFGFQSGPPPPCMAAADMNGDRQVVALTDALHALNFAFVSGPPPAAPFPDCGIDLNGEDVLGCDVSACP